MKKIALLILGLSVLASCTSLPAYHPASSVNSSGFSDQKIDETRYRVTFQGDAATPRYRVEDYLLFRAAELTDEKGFDYFIIEEKQSDSKTTLKTVRRPALYGRLNHFHGHPIYSFPYYAYGYDWGSPFETETREYTRYSAVAYIDMYKGNKPVSNKHAFDATEVMENLGPIECWKKQPHDEGKCKLSHPTEPRY